MRGDDGGGDSFEAAKKPGKTGRGKIFLYPVAGVRKAAQRKPVRAKHPVKFHAERKNLPREEAVFPARSLVAAAVAVTATYAYFLIFAQFGLLRALANVTGGGEAFVRPVMATMGGAGIVGSVLMAVVFNARRARVLLAAGFVMAGAAAALCVLVRMPGGFFPVAALTGLGTGAVTVGLAAMLLRQTGAKRLGRCIGAGTGLAYALCNVPGIFAATAGTQAMLGVVAAMIGFLATQFFASSATEGAATTAMDPTRPVMIWVAGLLALVVADSAMFHHIQLTPALKTATWTAAPQLWANAAAHLAAGVIAGIVFDAGRFTAAMLTAAGALAGGGLLVLTGHGAIGAPLYAAAVSVYSAGLVFYPASSGRVKLAALVYAVAGWAGTALGIGLAESLR
jgi:hypothetical protein